MRADIENHVTECGKMGYISEKAANTAKNTIKKNTRTAQNTLPHRAYFCTECNWWHLTHFRKGEFK